MLGPRYRNDGVPRLTLNSVQRTAKSEIEEKIRLGKYRFETFPCAICSKMSFEILAEKERYGIPNSVVICRECGLIQANPRMTNATAHEFFEKESRRLWEGIEGPSNSAFERHLGKSTDIWEFIHSHFCLSKKRPQLVVEVGCGIGSILGYFRDKGFRTLGIDIAGDYVSFGKSQFGLDLRVCTTEQLDLLGEKADLIIYSSTLEFCPDPITELRTAARFLSDNGLMYIGVAGIKKLRETYESDFLFLLQESLVCYFSFRTLRNAAQMAGLENIKGTEFVRSLWRKVETEAVSNLKLENDYADSMRALRSAEFWRPFYSSVPIKLGRKVFGDFTGALRRILNDKHSP